MSFTIPQHLEQWGFSPYFRQQWLSAAEARPELAATLAARVVGVRRGECVLNDGAGYLLSTGEKGQKVHQILANYQAAVEPRRAYGGGGFLRLMQFHPDRKTVQVRSYSPWFDAWLTEPDHQFAINLTA